MSKQLVLLGDSWCMGRIVSSDRSLPGRTSKPPRQRKRTKDSQIASLFLESSFLRHMIWTLVDFGFISRKNKLAPQQKIPGLGDDVHGNQSNSMGCAGSLHEP
jgi:hypothetical protein